MQVNGVLYSDTLASFLYPCLQLLCVSASETGQRGVQTQTVDRSPGQREDCVCGVPE